MPLPTPILDDRSYAQLRDELVRRIPVYTPEWTDHNASDPGITLLELFAFLGENLLFRFNQIPESTKIEFLHLLQIPLRAAAAARAMVALTTKEPAGVLVPLATETRAGALPFETRTEAVVLPLTTRAVLRAASAAPTEPEAVDFAARAIDARGLAAGETAAYYQTMLAPEDPSAPDALPLDFGAAVDGMLWVAVLRTKETVDDLLLKQVVNVGFMPDETITGVADVEPCPGEGAATTGPAVVWEISTGRVSSDGTPVYLPLQVVGDTTRGLTQQGVVRLRLPEDPDDLGVFAVADADLVGTGALPPALDDEEMAANLLFWLHAFRKAAPGQPEAPLGRVLWVGANAVEVVQTAKALPEFLGTGDAQPDQRYPLVHRPVVEGSLVVEVEEPDGWTAWTAVDEFHASGEEDRHYVLDLEAATVRFGNGLRGRAPQLGQRIRALEYRYGGGIEGNVAAKAITKVLGFGTVKAENPLAARGGAPAETTVEALERLPGELRRRDRAVTRGDFRELALMTPGADVGRAECVPLFHPHTGLYPAAGVVTVVVWPREDAAHPNAPMPDRTLLRQVCCWLDARRLVTTELHVVPPTYRKVAVSVGLQVKPGYGVEAVRRWVELVIRQYLAPLPPYGPEGQGWSLGHRVHGPELEAAALQVEGVLFLEGLRVSGLADDGVTWTEGTVVLDRVEVPELTTITVVHGAPLVPGVEIAPPVPPGVLVPIPTIKEQC